MAQHDYNIANQTAPNTRSDLNNALSAIVSQNSGATAPSNTFANMLWYDTTNNILKMRSEADDAWIDLFNLDQSNNTSEPSSPGGLIFIESQDASASATLDFTGFDSTLYDSYLFVGNNLVPATDGAILETVVSTNGGSSYAASLYAYTLSELETDAFGAEATNRYGAQSTSRVVLTDNVADNYHGVSFTLDCYGPHLSAFTFMTWNGAYQNPSVGMNFVDGSGVYRSTTAVDAIRYLYNSGNIASGTISMYGRKNA